MPLRVSYTVLCCENPLVGGVNEPIAVVQAVLNRLEGNEERTKIFIS